MQRDSDSHESLRCAWPGERRVELDDERPLKHSTRTSQPHRLPLSHSTVRPGHHHRQRQPAPGVHTGTRTHSTVHSTRFVSPAAGLASIVTTHRNLMTRQIPKPHKITRRESHARRHTQMIHMNQYRAMKLLPVPYSLVSVHPIIITAEMKKIIQS